MQDQQWWHLAFGNLGYGALPFYSAIATAAASLVVIAAIGVTTLITVFGKWRPLWFDWLTSLDHKRIGIM